MKNFSKEIYIKNIKEYYIKNYFGVVVLILFALIISHVTDKDYIKGVVSITFASFITWFGHYLMHNYNKYNPIATIHQYTHHSPFADTFLGKLIEYVLVEFLFFGSGISLIIVILYYRKYNKYLLNPYILLFWSISVPIIHEVYYHILNKSSYHKLHHKTQNKYYSSDHWDSVFMTKEDNSRIEDESNISIVILAICIFTCLLINTKYDYIKYFSENK